MTAKHNSTQTEIWLIRHGETAWSLSGQHTGRSDIPLTENGRSQASALRSMLDRQSFELVLCSPMKRAVETCRLAGLAERAQLEPRLQEWDYGIYEGRTTSEIVQSLPGWSIWNSPVPEGESIEQIQARAESLMQRLLMVKGRIALFAHAHIFRVLAGCWIDDSAYLGAHLALGTGTVSVLGFDHEYRSILRWNQLPD